MLTDDQKIDIAKRFIAAHGPGIICDWWRAAYPQLDADLIMFKYMMNGDYGIVSEIDGKFTIPIAACESLTAEPVLFTWEEK